MNTHRATTLAKLPIALEMSTVYLLIQIFVWHWQFTSLSIAWFILILLLATHWWHRDTMTKLGFRVDNFFPALKEAVWASVPFVLVLVAIGFLTGRLWTIPLQQESILPSLRYTAWGTFQQYGLQGYFHNRLMKVVSNPILSSILNGFIFMSLHIPNPILMAFTLLGGFAFSILYAKNRNIFALGILHGLVGLLLSNCFPRGMLHNMRVGPGYFH
jgi:membrane protease YdiL (CAAX protease family)